MKKKPGDKSPGIKGQSENRLRIPVERSVINIEIERGEYPSAIDTIIPNEEGIRGGGSNVMRENLPCIGVCYRIAQSGS